MASSINASTSGAGGVITTADNSGILNLQSAGVTVATVQPSGLSLPTNSTFNAANTFGFKNRLINGNMVIDQRNSGAAVTGSATAFTVDRWRAYTNGGGTTTYTQSTTVPNGNFIYSVVVTTTATGTPVESGFTQYIEGYNIADLGFGTANAQTLTASFWIRSSVTGTYCFSLRQGSGARSFVSTFTISSANTWQQVVVPIAGDTSGSYSSGNSAGFIFEICLGSSTLQTSTTNAWQAGNFVCTSAQTNLQATNGATCYITGCQLEIGSQATSFDFRSIGTELALCQRYYQIATNQGAPANGGYSTFAYASGIGLPVWMRIGTQTVVVTQMVGYPGGINRIATTSPGTGFGFVQLVDTNGGGTYTMYNWSCTLSAEL